MILLSHPSGNTFVRALLTTLEEAQLLSAYHTTLAVQKNSPYLNLLPANLRQELLRRTYDLPPTRIHPHPLRELVRLIAPRLGARFLTTHETGWASVDGVYQGLDRSVAHALKTQDVRAVYCYEDAALATFEQAKKQGVACIYDLPIAYWQTSQRLLQEEAQRLPLWEPTLVGTRDSQAKLERKTAELALADVVVTPSGFVHSSLPQAQQAKGVVAEFGSPTPPVTSRPARPQGPLRLLFAGSLTQRKGLADVFSAVGLLRRRDIELVVMGSPVLPLEFYRSQCSTFTYETTRPHAQVLELMQACDVFILPSLVEGRALVQQEALSCGLPLIVTAHAGAEDLIVEGETGFLVPIRSPEAIAEKIAWFADHRDALEAMRPLAQHQAAKLTWATYGQKIVDAIHARVGA
ncbi:glycosyltransferase family 4 protein [Anthocerotibacter panamensis]|uniref:glycosyltransferase family 4 protein n=1 Tax=Anthocerotibacter panamensis TaxID=2857077 RepID=UPI001C40826C|nr:glycosyltransferase family 4 protein [Anthocerotibacter panamensis]